MYTVFLDIPITHNKDINKFICPVSGVCEVNFQRVEVGNKGHKQLDSSYQLYKI